MADVDDGPRTVKMAVLGSAMRYASRCEEVDYMLL